MRRLAKKVITAILPGPAAVRFWSARRYRGYSRANRPGPGIRHGLPGELIVSLTSDPPRYATLHLTLRSLMRQDMMPDRIVLWIARGQDAALPSNVRNLIGHGIEMRTVDDVRGYKKLVFALRTFPEAYIATADDGMFYKPQWLAELVAGLGGDDHVITCHRAHRVTRTPDGMVARYRDWAQDVQDEGARQPSGDIVGAATGGILYPPGSLHSEAIRRDLYQSHAPSADDLWFFWCARRAGTAYRKVGARFEQLGWWSAPKGRRMEENMLQNDIQAADLLRRYGDPTLMPVAAMQGAPAA